ncbi:transposase family protein [Nitrosomonas sp. Nm34]|uniref:transposase family protein n=1 Tax=Nitrosomonas sp. Nm34 TaxID=1881055 RepID=UPI0008F3EE46|nr:transposase family protein [Nitrosomonas sp. Nm34]SFI80687.1 hypothetical protein SAMN05428978_10392 [Nitrosomonas sp. Nm34]
MGTTAIFYASDDFCKEFQPRWEQHLLESSLKRRRRQGALCLSEVMTIMVGFHLSGYRTFKHYYLNDVLRYQRGYFPRLVSYNRLVKLLKVACESPRVNRQKKHQLQDIFFISICAAICGADVDCH